MIRPLLLVALIGCGEADTSAVAPKEHAAKPAEAPSAPATPAAPAGAAAAHQSMSEHMAKMAATREELRAALGEAYDQPVPGLDAADAAAGAGVYAARCASCHGAAGKGDGAAGASLNPPPSDLTDTFHAKYYADAGRVHLIRNGSPGTAMAAFKDTLSDREILDLYAFVRKLREPGAP